MDAAAVELSEAGLVKEYVSDDGEPAMRLAPDGERVAPQMAMSDEWDKRPAVA